MLAPFFAWLKSYMPRSLYWRAALILFLPFLALQIIVSIVFIQRHFEDVTRQMTDSVAVSVSYVLDLAEAEGLEAAQAPAKELGIRLQRAGTLPSNTGRAWFDLSGLTVISRLEELFDTQTVELRERRDVDVWIARGDEIYRVGFERKRVSARNPHQLLVLMVVAGLFVALVSFVFLRNQLRPVARLGRAAEAFGRGRMLPYSPGGATEVRAAGGAFLDMRARIERQMEQRTLLLSGVSHDLRTPLTRMKLGLSLLEPSEDITALRDDVADMSEMIDAFLDFARDGAGEEPVKTDLAELLRDCLTDAARSGSSVRGKGCTVQARELPEIEMPLRAMGVKRSISNLLSNAMRYGNTVRLSADVLDRTVRVRIEDDGPGIAREDREAAVRPFMRLDESRNQNKGGSVGLGLSIAADIARRHGGTLRLSESEDLGGLCADLLLPK